MVVTHGAGEPSSPLNHMMLAAQQQMIRWRFISKTAFCVMEKQVRRNSAFQRCDCKQLLNCQLLRYFLLMKETNRARLISPTSPNTFTFKSNKQRSELLRILRTEEKKKKSLFTIFFGFNFQAPTSVNPSDAGWVRRGKVDYGNDVVWHSKDAALIGVWITEGWRRGKGVMHRSRLDRI